MGGTGTGRARSQRPSMPSNRQTGTESHDSVHVRHGETLVEMASVSYYQGDAEEEEQENAHVEEQENAYPVGPSTAEFTVARD